MSQEHFIKNIEIKNFKLFKDFKAEGFGRVNLIGGKNNVGKTAFMEACYLFSIDIQSKEFVNRSIVIEMHRNSLDFLLEWVNDYQEFKLKYINSRVAINSTFIPVKLKCRYGNYKNKGLPIELLEEEAKKLQHFIEILDYKENLVLDNEFSLGLSEIPKKDILNSFYKKGEPPLVNNSQFISVGNNFNNYLINFIDEIKLADREDDLNKALKIFFDIEKIDIIKNQVMLKKDSKYLMLNEYGDGVKHFLNILLALYLNKNNILYLDEIESGIHYSNYDKLWEIILTISKEQNVQVFATTHSKECIESYARVAKKLKDNEITFTELGKNKNNQIKAIVMDNERFFRELEVGNEVRGW